MPDSTDVLPQMARYVADAAGLSFIPYYAAPFDYFEYLSSQGVAWDLPIISRAFDGQSDPVIDIACGWGRVALHLRDEGHHVVAVDQATDAIERLRRLAAGGEPRAGWLEPVAADALRFLREHPGAFGGAVIGDISINAFADERALRSLFASVLTALRPGGRFVLSALESRRLRQLSALDGTPFSVRLPLEDGREAEMITALLFSEATGELMQNCFVAGGDAVARPIFSVVREKMWEASEVRALLEAVGFVEESATPVRIPRGGLEGAEVVVFTLRAGS